MKKVYENRAKELIERYNEDQEGFLVANIKATTEPRDTIFEGILRYIQNGNFAIYMEDIENDLKYIYGEDYDPTRYYNKDGSFKVRNNNFYISTIYAQVMASVIWKVYGEELRK